MSRTAAHRISATALAIVVIAGLLTVATPAPSAARDTDLFVAPDGTGERCARQAPCTLDTAQSRARALTARAGSADVVVNLLSGTYTRTEPWRLTDQDSGTDGRQVIYQAAFYGTPRQAEPVLTGGRTIDGWERVEDGSALWRAPIGDLRTRQLYVDGRRAQRAHADGPIPGEVTTSGQGYLTTDNSVRSWQNPRQIEVSWLGGATGGGFQWAEPRCKVADIVPRGDQTLIKIAQPCFDHTREIRQPDLTQPTNIENARELLDSPGEWYLDESEQQLYYKPRRDESPNSTEIVAPVLQSLVQASGTVEQPLHDLQLRGLTFAETTHLGPESPEGYPEVSYTSVRVPLAPGEEHNKFWPGGIKLEQMPAAITVGLATDVIIEGNTFTRLGQTALTLDNGSQQVTVRGNVFTDISGQGIEVGNVDVTAESGPMLVTGNTVIDNYLSDVGAEYHGGYAIQISAAERTAVQHNLMTDLPRGGIANNEVYIRGDSINHGQTITNNVISDWGQVILDGGGFDANGLQYGPDGKQHGTLLAENVFAHGRRGFGQIYLDNWSAGYTVRNNIAYDNSFRTSMMRIVQRDSPCCNQVRHNYWDKAPAWGHTDQAVDNPVLDVDAMPASILAASGPRHRWFDTLRRAARGTGLDELRLPAFSGGGRVAAPTEVRFGRAEPGPTLPIRWRPGHRGSAATGYEVNCSRNGEDWRVYAATGADEAETTIKGLEPGDRMQCAVRARNAQGALSEPSRQIRSKLPGTGDLHGRWTFDDEAGSVATDTSGSGNDADLRRLVGRYEAEDGELVGGVFDYPMGSGVGQTGPEYYPAHTGSGAVSRYDPPKAAVSQTVSVPEDGRYLLDFRYSASREGNWDRDGSRTLSLYVNGERRTLRFDWTGSWGALSNHRVPVRLQQGENSVALKAEEGDHGWIVYDHLNVLAAAPATDGAALDADGTVTADAGTSGVNNFGRGSFTVSSRFSSAGGSGRLVSKGFHNDNAVGYALMIKDGRLRFGVGSNWQQRQNFVRVPREKSLLATTVRTDLDDGEVHDVAVVVDRSAETVRIYVDGTAQPLRTPTEECATADGSVLDIADCTRAVASSYDPLTFGSYANTLDFAEAAIDEVALYDRPLSEDEVARMHRR